MSLVELSALVLLKRAEDDDYRVYVQSIATRPADLAIWLASSSSPISRTISQSLPAPRHRRHHTHGLGASSCSLTRPRQAVSGSAALYHHQRKGEFGSAFCLGRHRGVRAIVIRANRIEPLARGK
jgi:hypothetical protein